MSFEWKDRVVVITGASGGIGAALAHEVGRRGGSLVLAARRLPELDAVAKGVVATDFGKNAVGGGLDSRALPNAQPVDEVARVIADAVAAQKNGDVYTFPGAVDRILKFFQDLAQA
jgi:NAD(P)-dependent dehydrogenase (short-subunit alcohol dehydrogenase family)